MPASYVIDKQRRLVISTATGVVTAEECKQHQDRLVNDPDFDPTFNQILDFTEANTIQLNEATLRFLAVRHVFRAPSRRAILSNSQQFTELMEKSKDLRKQFLGTDIIEVFSDRDEALLWLNSGNNGQP